MHTQQATKLERKKKEKKKNYRSYFIPCYDIGNEAEHKRANKYADFLGSPPSPSFLLH